MNIKRYRDAAVVLLALALPFGFLRVSMKSDPTTLTSPVDKFLVRIITPIQNAVGILARGLSGYASDYVYLVDVKADNADLVAENARLEARVRELEGFEAENRRLRGLLEVRERNVTADMVSAEVIAKDTSEYFRVAQVTLDKPSAEITGSSRMPVITMDGVVGVTGQVASETVEVQLVVDAGFAVDVVVERTGARGFVRGAGNERAYRCRVEYVKRDDEVEVGDVLVTSGWGRRFPPGIPVARVTEVIRRDFGIYQAVEAEPTVDFSRLREVLIVVSHGGQVPPEGAEAERGPR
ncbi:MAG: rod shape-determining protein MreC [Myxococcota bacterium]